MRRKKAGRTEVEEKPKVKEQLQAEPEGKDQKPPCRRPRPKQRA